MPANMPLPVRLTGYNNGEPIMVNAALIRCYVPYDFADGRATMVKLPEHDVFVRETLEEITKAIARWGVWK